MGQVAAIRQMDQAVRGEVVEVDSVDDPKLAIKQLDRAVAAEQRDRVALWKAAANCQRLRAHLADNEFLDWEASSAATAAEGGDPATSRFKRWIEHRYGFKRSYATQLTQAGRVHELLAGNPPANEWQMRPLYPLLKHEQNDPGIVDRIWAAASESAEAEHKPESVAKHITRLIEENGLKAGKTLAEEERQLDADIKRFRHLFSSLRKRMDNPAFNKRVMGWIEGELG